VSLFSQEQIYTPPEPDDVLHITDLVGRVCGHTTRRRLSSTAKGRQKLRERVREINAAIRWWYADRARSRYIQRLKELEARAAGVYDTNTLEEKRKLLRCLKAPRQRIRLLVQRTASGG
jgi:hypothetical protein